jgi:hypothetical protein
MKKFLTYCGIFIAFIFLAGSTCLLPMGSALVQDATGKTIGPYTVFNSIESVLIKANSNTVPVGLSGGAGNGFISTGSALDLYFKSGDCSGNPYGDLTQIGEPSTNYTSPVEFFPLPGTTIYYLPQSNVQTCGSITGTFNSKLDSPISGSSCSSLSAVSPCTALSSGYGGIINTFDLSTLSLTTPFTVIVPGQ